MGYNPFMATSILVTKLYIPSIRTKLVHRPDLVKRLNDGLNRKLTLISAPAGFGKTTLVSSWVDSLRRNTADEDQKENKLAWLSLDERDNDQTRFLVYLISALRTIKENFASGVLSTLQSPQPPPYETTLTSLINEVPNNLDRIVLVLDDYHLIEAPSVHDALIFLLENQPPNFHLVIATREDPSLKLARLRARGQLTELRAADLRFTSSEAAEFLNQVMGLDLATDDVVALEARTEGWIAGLQLAALSIQGSDDSASFIKSFTGSHRLVMDYLIEEVLNNQAEIVQDFLVRTSILDRLTGSLCDALTGQEDGQATLEMLERANLFIVPMDDNRHWYRYHHLFAEILRQHLVKKHGSEVSGLHANASGWYEAHEQGSDAVRHAVLASDYERAAQLVEQHTVDIFTQGNLHALLRWIKALPSEVTRSRPWLCIYHAWGLAFAGQLSEVEDMLAVAESIVQPEIQPDSCETELTVDTLEILGNIAAIRAFIAVMSGDFPRVLDLAQRAEKLMNPKSKWAGSVCQWAMGYSHYVQGDLKRAVEYFTKTIQYGRSIENIWTIVTGMTDLASVYREQGRLHRCVSLCQEAMQLADEYGAQSFGYVGRLESRLADVLCEQNKLSDAIQYANSGVEKAHKWKNPNHYAYAYYVRGRVLHAQGDTQGSLLALAEADRMRHSAPLLQIILLSIESFQVRLWLSSGDLAIVKRWVEETQINNDSSENATRLITNARVLIAQEKPEKALEILKRVEKKNELENRLHSYIQVLILIALAQAAKNEVDIALEVLEKSFSLATQEGYVRMFVDEGIPMAQLLYEALNRGIKPEYVSQLLAAFSIDESEQTEKAKTQSSDIELFEPLSEREIEVLQLMAKGLTNQVIATRLYLSPHTIKVHTRNIYGKLNVHNRTEAVDRARTLGILDSG